MSDLPYSGYVIFRTKKLFKDRVKIKDRELYVDPSFNPQKNVNACGYVDALPLKYGTLPIPIQEWQGTPPYHDIAAFKFKRLQDIEPVLELDDLIYFHFNTLQMRNCIAEEGSGDDKTWFFHVRVDNILCAVRDGQIIPVGSYTLVEPNMETWEDILVPTYSPLKDKFGKNILKPKDQWLQKKVAPEALFLQGFIRHIGSPLDGDTCELKVGDKVWYRNNANWENEIEGKTYYTIRQRHFLGKEVDGVFVPVNGYMLLEGEAFTERSPSGRIIIKKTPLPTGIVSHPGASNFKIGQEVMFGKSERTVIELDKKPYYIIRIDDVFASKN